MAVLGHTTLPSEIDWKIDCRDALISRHIGIDPILSFVSRTRSGTCLTLRIMNWDMQMNFAQKPSDSYNTSVKMELSGGEDCTHRLHSMLVNLGLSEVYVFL